MANENTPATPETAWAWWSSDNGEQYWHGPCATRDEAIEAARQDQRGEFQDDTGTWKVRVYVCEARQDPVMLSEWVDVERMIEDAENDIGDSDRICGEFDDGPFFDYPGQHDADLRTRIKRACDEWQAAHGIVFTVRTFSHSRSEEMVVVPHPNDDTSSEPNLPPCGGDVGEADRGG